jgi:hypothetical protein
VSRVSKPLESLGPNFEDIGDREGEKKVIMRIGSNTLLSSSSSLSHGFAGIPTAALRLEHVQFRIAAPQQKMSIKTTDAAHGQIWQSEISRDLLFFCSSQYTPQLFGKEWLLKKNDRRPDTVVWHSGSTD